MGQKYRSAAAPTIASFGQTGCGFAFVVHQPLPFVAEPPLSLVVAFRRIEGHHQAPLAVATDEELHLLVARVEEAVETNLVGTQIGDIDADGAIFFRADPDEVAGGAGESEVRTQHRRGEGHDEEDAVNGVESLHGLGGWVSVLGLLEPASPGAGRERRCLVPAGCIA